MNSIRVFYKLFLGLLLLLACSTYSYGAVSAGYSEYYIPGEEVSMWTIFNTLDSAGTNTTMHTVISVTAWSDNTIIYYDHWEDGYDFDPADPAATADERVVLAGTGDQYTFESADIPTAPRGTNTYYDGGDYIYVAGGAVTVTRASWIEAVGVGNQSAAWEIYPVKPQLTTYVLPFGENLGFADFNRVFVLVQATEDNTTFTVDLDGDGTLDVLDQNRDGDILDPGDTATVTLQRGETFLLDRVSANRPAGNITSGTIVQGSATLQIKFVAGNPGQTYCARGLSAFPRGFWTTDYYAPLDDPTNSNTDYYLYNPNPSSLTVNWESLTSSGSFSIPAGSTVSYLTEVGAVPADSGLYFKADNEFWGVGINNAGGATYEWGFSLLPSTMLYQEHFLGWAPGSLPLDATGNPGGQNDDGVFLVAAQDNTRVFVDFNNDGDADMIDADQDGTPESNYVTLNRLQTQFFYDPDDGDMSEAHFWATGAFTMAYGENSDGASTSSPSLDLGYVAIPGSDFISLVLTVDKSVDSEIVATASGSQSVFTLKVNSQKYSIDDVEVTDTLPPDWQFVPGFTTITKPDMTQTSSTAGAGTVTTDGTTAVVGSGTTFTSLTAGDPITIAGVGYIIQSITDDTHLTITTSAPAASGSTYYTLGGVEPTITGSGTAVDPYVLTWSSALVGGDMAKNQEISITFTAQTTTALAAGTLSRNRMKAAGTRTVGSETQTFTATDFVYVVSGEMTVEKTSSATDPVYPGDQFTYTVTATNPSTATTNLTGVSIYDPLPAGVSYVAGSGSVTCDLPANVRDQFGTAAYTNNNGSENWSGAWTETDPGPGAAGATAGFVWITAGQLQFRYLMSNVLDEFNTNGSYNGNDGSTNWNAAWTELNDDGSAASGNIWVTGNHAQFERFNAGRLIRRTATVTGATSATISFLPTDAGIDSGDTIVAEYSLNGGGYVNIGTYDGGTGGWSGVTQTLTINPLPVGTNTITVQFSAPSAWGNNDRAYIDNVDISFNAPADASGTQIQRTADLSTATSPVLSFSYVPANLESGDTLVVEASTGGSFTTLGTYTGGSGFDTAPPYDLTSYISATTTIRFRVTGGFDVDDESLSFDNVDITYYGSSTFASGSPPNFLSSGTGCVIRPDNDLTLTYDVIVDNPLAVGIEEITNTAYINSNEIIVPLRASVTNIVSNPSSGSAEVGDRVWLDSDRDGVLDVGEPGLANVEVTLKDQFGTPLMTTTTDGTGHYLFTGVVPGNGYYVEATSSTIPAGLVQSAPSGHTDNRTDPFDISDSISIGNNRDQFDTSAYTNNDGTLNWAAAWAESDAGGAGAGTGYIRVTGGQLRINNDSGVTTQSIARGYDLTGTGATAATFTFDYTTSGNLEPADVIYAQYRINSGTWTTFTGGTFTDDVSGSASFSIPLASPANLTEIRFAITSASSYTGSTEYFYVDNVNIEYSAATTINDYLDADLGYGPPAGTATFGDLVWSDFDSDGVHDSGEPGLTGVTVQLWQDDGDLLWDPGTDLLISSTVTAAGGSYLFTGVTATGTEDYFLFIDPTQAVLTGFTETTVNPLLVEDVNADDVVLILDFGFLDATGTYTIKDRVWYDANVDEEDDGESGIGGVTVDLLDASLNVIASTITDANGYFSFNGVIGAGADYTVRITDTGGILSDYYGITAEAIAGEVEIDNLSSNLDYTVEPTEPHFGYGLTRSISGTVFNDLDGDGSLDAGEPGMGGIDISLYNDVNSDGLLDGGDTLESSLVTDSNGNYLFSGLDDGNYIISISSPPAGYDYTTEIPDNDPASGDQQTATISGGGNVQNKNFGYQAQFPRSISGTLWEDNNADGIIDAGENGFEGVTVELLDGSTVVASTSTDSNGDYSFSGLTPITYTVRITDTFGVLSGYEATYEFDTFPPFDGEASADLSGGDLTGADFGYNKPDVTLATISSFRAYEDKGRVVIEWTTSSEIDTAGFYLFRLDEPTGNYTKINNNLLPALLTSPQGGTYSLIDRVASPGGSYIYILIEVEGKGKMLTYGPFTVQVGGDSAIGAPVSSTSTINTGLLSNCIASKCTDKQKTISPAAITKSSDINGNIVITNRKNSAITQGLSYVGADQYSNYTMKEHKSADKENRIKTLKEMKNATALQQSKLSGNIAKISVTEDGLYYLSASQISTLLGTSSKDVMKRIKNTQLIIRNQGQKVAYLPAAGYTGIFFYGEGIDSIYTKENIYWLEGNKGLQMEYIKGKGPGQTGSGTFTETLHAEEDRYFIANAYMDPESDYWFWDYIVGGSASMGTRTFTIQADGVANISYNALMTVNLQGYTNTSANPDHHVEVSLNGTTLVPSVPKKDRWDGEEPNSVTYDIDQSIEDLLMEGVNTIEVKGLLDTGAPYSMFYIDSFDLTYQRLYEAAGNTLFFKGEGNQVVTVYGFTNPDILVVDVTDPRKPKLNKATTIDGQAGQYRVSFTPTSPDTLYLAISSDAAITDVNAWADTPSSLLSNNGADYIVITIEELADAAQSLANYRQSQGLKTMVVKLKDIMDEFNNGIYSPEAIHDFLTYAYQNWSKPPRYVVLAGDGTYDYKDNLGHGDNLIPTMIVHTPLGLFPSDNVFADVDDDHVPEMAVGRLPVVTPDELQDVLNKIIAYEGSVSNRIILTADNPDGGGNYPADSEEIAALVPPQYPAVKIYLSEHQADQARQMLLNEMNSGAFLLNYIGHAGVGLLADEGLLRTSDLGSLTNLYGLPIVTAMTCIVGQFALPGYDSLSEELVIKTDGGAVAVWAPTGLSYNSESKILDQKFFKTAFENNTAILGDTILQALKEYSTKGGFTFTMDIYNLQGDPALKIR
jgi:uncharacterized repeat protein (TIGR01451 family)